MGRLMVGRIWESGIRDATHLAVLCGIAVFANEKTGKCYPSLPRVMQASRRSKNVVRAAIKDLQRLGYLTVTEYPGKGRNYTVHVERLPMPDQFRSELGSELNSEQNFTGCEREPCEGSEVRRVRNETEFRNEPQNREEPGKEIGNERGGFARDAREPPPPTDSDLESMASTTELVEDEVLFDDLETEAPLPKKPKRQRTPTELFPTKLPEEWRLTALKVRPDVNPFTVFQKLRVRYGPTTIKKTLGNWRRIFFNWLGSEYGHAKPETVKAGARSARAIEPLPGTDYSRGVNPDGTIDRAACGLV